MEIAASMDLCCISECQLFEALGQLRWAWHPCASDQHGNDRYPAFECKLDFHSHGIGFIVDPTNSARIGAKPTRTDYHDHHVVLCQYSFNVVSEINT
jgi:hypothetical protein